MNKLLLPLCLTGFLLVPTLIQRIPLQAQSSFPLANPIYIPPKPIGLALNPKTDGVTFRPADRPQNDKPSDTTQGIRGADNRIPLNSRDFPWSAIGRLDVIVEGKEIPNCTATLIGKDIVLTNSHCIFDEKNKKLIPNTIVFKPALINGKSLDQSTATILDYGWKSMPGNRAEDWAILQLNKPLGNKYGYLGWRVLDFSDQRIRLATKDQIRLVGYSSDFPKGKEAQIAGVHTGCSIEGLYEDKDGKSLAHICDSNPGSSGGPLFALFTDGNYYIVGLNAGGLSLSLNSNPRAVQDFNYGVEASRWASKANSMRQAKSE